MVNHKYEHEKHRVTFLALHQVTLDIKEELKQAAFKHGMEQTPANPTKDVRDSFIILSEEFGEVARALTYDEGSTESLISELIQTATMAAAMVVGLRLRQIEESV